MSQQGTIRRLSAEDEEMYATPNSSPAKKDVRKLDPGLAKSRKNRRFTPAARRDTATRISQLSVHGVEGLKFGSHDGKCQANTLLM
jgi:hypothetical protein